MTTSSTRITVRVIAKGGKFLGADIGSAQVTIRDADTSEFLADGTTIGGSGNTTVPSSIGVPPLAPHYYESLCYAYEPGSGNTGLQRVTFYYLPPTTAAS